jgi:hypothetical protein
MHEQDAMESFDLFSPKAVGHTRRQTTQHSLVDELLEAPEAVSLRLIQAGLITQDQPVRVNTHSAPPVRSRQAPPPPRVRSVVPVTDITTGAPPARRRRAPVPPAQPPTTHSALDQLARMPAFNEPTTGVPASSIDDLEDDDWWTMDPPAARTHAPIGEPRRNWWLPIALLGLFVGLAGVPPVVAVVMGVHDATVSTAVLPVIGTPSEAKPIEVEPMGVGTGDMAVLTPMQLSGKRAEPAAAAAEPTDLEPPTDVAPVHAVLDHLPTPVQTVKSDQTRTWSPFGAVEVDANSGADVFDGN